MIAVATLAPMGRRADVFELGRLGLSSGEARRLDVEARIDPLEFGGQRYGPEPADVPVTLDVARTTQGYSLRLRYRARLSGPCARCLGDARRDIAVDAREVDQPGGGEDLLSPYVSDELLDLRSWARDALSLAVPAQIVCRDECLGLCDVCGENLNRAGPDHHHERPPDPRLAKLGELKLE
jgi:uncharacterized protein